MTKVIRFLYINRSLESLLWLNGKSAGWAFWLNVKSQLFLHFLVHRHKACGANPLGVARAACFEELAGVFASCGAMHHTNIFMNYSHDVNRLPVSLTSDANFVVNEFFSVTVVNELQVLLTTHESTNFSNLLIR
jgi:hypothetical protein